MVRMKEIPAYCVNIEGEPDGKLWFHDIKQYIKNRDYQLGISKNDKKTIRRLAT